jgi:hypothetical protein
MLLLNFLKGFECPQFFSVEDFLDGLINVRIASSTSLSRCWAAQTGNRLFSSIGAVGIETSMQPLVFDDVLSLHFIPFSERNRDAAPASTRENQRSMILF